MKNLLFISITVSVFLASCKSKQNISQPAIKDIPEKSVVIVPKVLNTDSLLAIEVKYRVSQIDSGSHEINNRFIFSNTVLPLAYIKADYKILWTSEKNRTEAIDALISSDEHGLLPTDYHIKELLSYSSRYDSLGLGELADYDILLTDAILLYTFHLIEGKVDPITLSSTWNNMGRVLPNQKIEILLKAIKEESIPETMYQFEPHDPEYKELLIQLKNQKEIVKSGGWSYIDIPETIHPSDKHSKLPALRKRLIAENYLQPNDTSSSTVYDKNLVEAMKNFQYHHGLNSDGIIGNVTMKMLNITAAQKQKMLVTNIERNRWLTYPTYKPYIMVNIASFRMQYIDNGNETYSSNVVVGKTQKQTPMFSDQLELVVFNPTWNLPFSITSTETLAKLKKDSTYLEKHNMSLIDRKGNKVSSEGIDWDKYPEGRFPYMVRQEPGPSNALGQVKFLFPNKYAIYLHDTPSKHLFSRDERAFSHGCIRLQDPLNFAAFLLSKQDSSWDVEKINEIIETQETETVRLKNKVPIFLIYKTVSINHLNEVFYYADIYERDENVYKKMIQPETRLELQEALEK